MKLRFQYFWIDSLIDISLDYISIDQIDNSMRQKYFWSSRVLYQIKKEWYDKLDKIDSHKYLVGNWITASIALVTQFNLERFWDNLILNDLLSSNR